ncbi:YaeQ family protein [Oleidesulfovibrio sp.]|uniref:YaeQ family protein n=1 Tax=Oleidesulfovibrio sp. TaxID=2909707 RepID=UPI003A87F098
MKYTCAITRHARDSTLRDKVVLRAGGSEVTWHIALKALGFILFMQHRPCIEEGVGWHYKPDLIAFDDEQRISLWVDCGNIAVRKIDRVASWLPRDAAFHILRRTAKDARPLAASAKGIRRPERVQLTAFDAGFVDSMADLLDVTNRIEASVNEAHIALSISSRRGNEELASALHHLTP